MLLMQRATEASQGVRLYLRNVPVLDSSNSQQLARCTQATPAAASGHLKLRSHDLFLPTAPAQAQDLDEPQASVWHVVTLMLDRV
jgi:hypothetical protein